MARRNGEYSPDEEHEVARPEPTLPDPGRTEGKAWYGDADRVSSAGATILIIGGVAFIIFLVIIACIKIAQWAV